MSLRKTAFVPKEYFHIYNRGNSKQVIFHDKSDYLHFMHLLYLSNTKRKVTIRDICKEPYEFDRDEQLVSIGAYCLMRNHFHILLTQTDDGSISKFMQKLLTAYSMYYNKKYSRTGSLFEGKFKAGHANNDRYLKYLFSYIHLNAVKIIDKTWKTKGIKNKQASIDFLKDYQYSSYQDYLGIVRQQNEILSVSAFPSYFPTKEKFKKEVFEWLSYGTP